MDYLSIARLAAMEAGKIISDLRLKASSFEKAPNNLVTEADLNAEKKIIDILSNSTPEIPVLSEETKNTTPLDSEWLWIVDPLDGTNNYAHGIPIYCVSIALAQKGVPVLGVIYDPERKELYRAQKNQGVFCNEKKLTVSNRSRLEESIIVTGFNYDRGVLMEKTLDSIHKLFKANIQGIRRSGSAALDCCWVAQGWYDAFFEYLLSPWDFAAGMLMVSEAGGMCSDRYGNPLELGSTGVIISNGKIHDNLVKKIYWQ